jgi:hypothetical protein
MNMKIIAFWGVCHVVKQTGNTSGKHAASIFRVEEGGSSFLKKMLVPIYQTIKPLCPSTDPNQFKLLTFLYGNECN